MTAPDLKQVEDCRQQFYLDIKQAAITDYDNLKIKYLGRNGLLSGLLKLIGNIPADQKPLFGKAVNELKQEITNSLEGQLQSKNSKEESVEIDTTLPGRTIKKGSLHPVTRTMREICAIFQKIGFNVVEGPEIETDYNNFTALNIPENHPARDMHDTFYFDSNLLLRTQTSPVQIRVMRNNKPPFRIISPGKVYRRDSDITHSPMFHQVEGLCVGHDINFGHLKFVLNYFARSVFGSACKLRFRPSYFPFTEPSAEIDISCVMCEGKGCRVCKNTGWLEILGAGMVNPKVLQNVDLDPKEYTGYAFGMGIERVAMLKYSINDIRLFYENHWEFLNQFV